MEGIDGGALARTSLRDKSNTARRLDPSSMAFRPPAYRATPMFGHWPLRVRCRSSKARRSAQLEGSSARNSAVLVAVCVFGPRA